MCVHGVYVEVRQFLGSLFIRMGTTTGFYVSYTAGLYSGARDQCLCAFLSQ